VSATPHVTVVVPVLNRREQMLRCLDGIFAQEYDRYDVVVVDNGSTDGTPEACRARAAQEARIDLRVEAVAGLVGAARNAGARIAAGELVAYTDSDCIPTPGWLAEGVKPFASDPSVGVVSGPTLPEEQPGRWAATQDIRDQTWRFEACNVIFRREALLAVEGFDETRTMWEDTVAGFSVMRSGWSAAFAPDAVVHHDVTYPGYGWHLRRVLRYGEVASVIGRYPEIADRLLWHRYFLRPRNARFALAALGVLLAPFDSRALVLAAPYAWLRRPPRPTPRAALDSVQLTMFDLAVLVGMVKGSIEAGTLVL
jgi:GT2 family glycosyltransferase